MKALEDREGGHRDDDDDFETSELNRLAEMQGHDDYLASQGDLAGKKLKGPTALTARIPLQFRYVMLRISDQSAIVRQWEDQLLLKGHVQSSSSNTTPALTNNQPLLSSRMFASRARCYPTMVFSVIKYDAGEEKAKIDKIRAEDQKGLEVFKLPGRDWRGFSYKPLFKPLAMLTEEQTSSRDVISSYYLEKGYLFDPDVLDDPSMLHGSHRYVLQKSASTGPIIIAIAVINFERLCLKNLVTKANRKLSMAVALILAVKFNENEQSIDYRKRFEALLTFFDREWDLAKKEVFEAEFGAYVHLGFALHIPHHHVYLVYTRLLKLVNKSSKSYLGETMSALYIQDVLDLERVREQLLEAIAEEQEAEAAKETAEGEVPVDGETATVISDTVQGDSALPGDAPSQGVEEEPLTPASETTTAAPSSGGFLGLLSFFDKDKDDLSRKRSGTGNPPASPVSKLSAASGRDRGNSNASQTAPDESHGFTRSETAPPLSGSAKTKSFYSSA
eukprot:gene38563-47623_t